MKRAALLFFVAGPLLLLGFYYVFVSQKVNPMTGKVNARFYGFECKNAGLCNDVTAIDCGAERDGPFYYVRSYSGEIISRCGGFCEASPGCGLNNCPPKEWTCK